MFPSLDDTQYCLDLVNSNLYTKKTANSTVLLVVIAIFATCNMNLASFVVGSILSLPQYVFLVYIGSSLKQVEGGSLFAIPDLIPLIILFKVSQRVSIAKFSRM